MKPRFFATPEAFRLWLDKHHATEQELLVGFFKKDSGRPSITWPQSVDVALCFGWIDGVRRSIDEQSYSIRFTPRKPASTWSRINIRRMGELTRLGLVMPAGAAAFARRSEANSGIYTYEQAEVAVLPEASLQLFHKSPAAWAFFERQPPGYRRLAVSWVTRAKQEPTRVRRLSALIEASAAGRRLAQYTSVPKARQR